MDDPSGSTVRATAELARDAAAIADELGAGMEVVGYAGGEWFCGGSGAVLRPGSITKVLTATAVLQCVDDGLLALDDPVDRWVPHVGEGVQVHHLLSHSSGIDAGDLFVDTGEDDDCFERYVALLDGVGTLFEPGETCSYNNAGMVIAGLITSTLRGMTFEDVLRTFVFERAGMTSATTSLERNGNPICARALGPAGSTVACTAMDLVRFAVSTDLVHPDTAARMRTMHVTAPGGVVQNAGFGLGWQIWRNEHGETARHGGAFPGMSAVLVHDVARDAAVAFMSPFGAGINSINPLLDPRGAVVTDVQPERLDVYAGRYESQTVKIAIDVVGDGLQLTLGGFPPMPISVVDRSTFTLAGEPFAFFGFDDDGAPRFLRFRMRVQPRVG
jgi:CubicO group peptidase (beta-lactamase class C family)